MGSSLKSLHFSEARSPQLRAKASRTTDQFLECFVKYCPNLELLEYHDYQLKTPSTSLPIVAQHTKLRTLSIYAGTHNEPLPVNSSSLTFISDDWSGLKTNTSIRKLLIRGQHRRYFDWKNAVESVALQRAINPPQIGFWAHFYNATADHDSSYTFQSLIVSAIKEAPLTTVKYLLNELGPENVEYPVLREYTALEDASTLLHVAINAGKPYAVSMNCLKTTVSNQPEGACLVKLSSCCLILGPIR